MTAHSVRLEQSEQGAAHYRWACSCGKHGYWNSNARNARAGGQMHQRLAENPRPPRRRAGKAG